MTRTLVIALSLLLGACVSLPDVYLIDRQTVMEAEASGAWPELEQRFRQTTPTMGPVGLAADPLDRRREQAFRVLDGEHIQSTDKAATP